MRAARLQELQEMAAKLLATARELPPGQDHYNALREIGRFCAQIDALQDADSIMIVDPIRTEEPNAVTNRKTDCYCGQSSARVFKGRMKPAGITPDASS